ncbi:MAG: hypothetical protein RI981_1017 [Bacteroidota bacterium]|jgi:predicted DCC family thiol-disulfide oxidoreductase YuxK
MLVIIDGDCTFCLWASKLLRRLCKPGLDILPLGSVGDEVLIHWSMNPLWSIDSIKVISAGKLYIKSKAVSVVLRKARWYAQPLRMIFLLPDSWLDLGYDWVARHRKSQACDFVIKKD